jgi:uncharacterized alkaline shock family protein YloU
MLAGQNGTSMGAETETGAGVPASAVAAFPDQAEDALRDDTPLDQLGSVRIARRVLRTVVEQAALGVPGVARMAAMKSGWPRRLGRPLPQHGVGLAVREGVVAVDLYLIVTPGASMVEVGSGVQEAAGAAIERILGMDVGEINVYIQDVA